MRQAFCAELDDLVADLAWVVGRAGQMMTDASMALWRADLGRSESIIGAEGETTTAMCEDIDRRCVRVLALQAPVATDLRLVVAVMHAVSDVMRMGKLARHIAKIARLKHPVVALPANLEPVFTRMALLATTLADDAAKAIKNRDPRCAEHLVKVEEEMGTLHRQLFQRLFAQEWSHGVEPAVDAALVARYYTRFADHAVAIARRTSFIVTGLAPQR